MQMDVCLALTMQFRTEGAEPSRTRWSRLPFVEVAGSGIAEGVETFQNLYVMSIRYPKNTLLLILSEKYWVLDIFF